MTDPLRRSFVVACDVEHAFRTWTARTSTWWPSSHTTSGERDVRIVIEPRVGGRIFERTAAGAEHEWGEVTAWDPPAEFGYRWYLRTVPANATDVTIRFTQRADDSTEIEIVQHGFDRLGDGPERRTNNDRGWSVVAPLFAHACGG